MAQLEKNHFCIVLSTFNTNSLNAECQISNCYSQNLLAVAMHHPLQRWVLSPFISGKSLWELIHHSS